MSCPWRWPLGGVVFVTQTHGDIGQRGHGRYLVGLGFEDGEIMPLRRFRAFKTVGHVGEIVFGRPVIGFDLQRGEEIFAGLFISFGLNMG